MTKLSGLGLLLTILIFVSRIHLSDGFEVVRMGRQCKSTISTSMYLPRSTVDANDMERFASLQRFTDPSADPFEVDMDKFTTMLNEFRGRTDQKCAEKFFPLPGTSNVKPFNVGAKSSAAIRAAIDGCMCKRTRDWLLQNLLATYKCDWPAAHQVDLWKLIKRKLKRFNRFVRYQLAINGDVAAVEMYDSIVDRCVIAHVDEQIGKLGATNGNTGRVDATKSKPAPPASPSSATPATQPRSPTKKPKDTSTKNKVTTMPAESPRGNIDHGPSSSASSPSSTVETPTRTPTKPSAAPPTAVPPVDTVDLAAAGSSTSSGMDSREECRTARATCNANEVLASDLSVLARRLSALLLAVMSVVVVVMLAVLVVVGIVCRRAWGRIMQRQGYQPIVPTEE